MRSAPLIGNHGPVLIQRVPYDSPGAVALTALAQAVYVVRYGGEDDSPIDAADFLPPTGVFFVGYDNGQAVAMGGWRRLRPGHGAIPGSRPAEIKRMFVLESMRRKGLAREILLELELSASRAGHDWLVLETGSVQPEAIALYRTHGYTDIPAFGHYCGAELSVHLGKALLGPGQPSVSAAAAPGWGS